MVIVHRSVRAQETSDRALVLLAMGIEHDIGRNLFGWWLGVPNHEETRAFEQLLLWEKENHRIGPLSRHAPTQPGAVAAAVAWTAILMLFYTLQSRYVSGVDWVTAGRVDGVMMAAGEWWRATTALRTGSSTLISSQLVARGHQVSKILRVESPRRSAWSELGDTAPQPSRGQGETLAD